MLRSVMTGSCMKSIGYDVEYHILEAELKNGELYQYFEVPLCIYYAVIRTPASENYFDRYIMGHYRCTRI